MTLAEIRHRERAIRIRPPRHAVLNSYRNLPQVLDVGEVEPQSVVTVLPSQPDGAFNNLLVNNILVVSSAGQYTVFTGPLAVGAYADWQLQLGNLIPGDIGAARTSTTGRIAFGFNGTTWIGSNGASVLSFIVAGQGWSAAGGFGAPAAGTGNNGDYYFRVDTPATALQRIYIKSAGAWVGIV